MNKSDAAEGLMEWSKQVQRTCGNEMTIQTFVSDQGGEYMGRDFQNFLKQHGTRHVMAPAYTPQHNTIVERANRTIGEMSECL